MSDSEEPGARNGLAQTVLRWFLFLPAAIVASAIVTLVVSLLWGAGVAIGGGSATSVGVVVPANALGGFAGVIVGAMVAPSASRSVVPASMATAVFLIWAGYGLWMDTSHGEPVSMLLQHVAVAVGAVAGLVMIIRVDLES